MIATMIITTLAKRTPHVVLMKTPALPPVPIRKHEGVPPKAHLGMEKRVMFCAQLMGRSTVCLMQWIQMLFLTHEVAYV
jgi:hypothetical protein